MASPTNIPDLLKAISGASAAQLQLLKDQSQHGRQLAAAQQQYQARAAGFGFGSSVGGALASFLPQGASAMAGSIGSVAGGGMQAMNALSTARQAAAAAEASGGSVSGMTAVLATPGLGEAVAAAGVAILALKAVIVDLPTAIYNWTESLLDSQKAIAKYSPELSAIFLKLESKEIVRGASFGRMTYRSTGELADASSGFKDAILPLQGILTNIENRIGARLLELMTDVAEGIADLLGVAQDFEKPGDFNAFAKVADNLEKEHKAGRRRGAGEQPFAGR